MCVCLGKCSRTVLIDSGWFSALWAAHTHTKYRFPAGWFGCCADVLVVDGHFHRALTFVAFIIDLGKRRACVIPINWRWLVLHARPGPGCRKWIELNTLNMCSECRGNQFALGALLSDGHSAPHIYTYTYCICIGGCTAKVREMRTHTRRRVVCCQHYRQFPMVGLSALIDMRFPWNFRHTGLGACACACGPRDQ